MKVNFMMVAMTASLKCIYVLPTGPVTLNMTDLAIIQGLSTHTQEITEISKVRKMATYAITHVVFSHKTVANHPKSMLR